MENKLELRLATDFYYMPVFEGSAYASLVKREELVHVAEEFIKENPKWKKEEKELLVKTRDTGETVFNPYARISEPLEGLLQREYIKYVETKVNESHPHNERGILITDIYLSIISKVKEGSAIVLADTTPDFFNSGSTWSHPPSDFEEFKLPLYVIEKRMDEIEKVVNNGDFVAIVKSDVSSYTYYWLVPLNNFKSI